MGGFASRLGSATAIASGHAKLLATGIEAAWGTRYTIDTLLRLRRRFPRARFVWLMGADNLRQFPLWQGWTRILRLVPVAVYPRPGHTRPARAGLVARAYRAARVPGRSASSLAGRRPPAWTLLDGPEHPASATAIRAARTGKTSIR